MAGPYYCNLAEDFVDRTGLDGTANVLTGPGGLLNAFTGTAAATPLAAGEILYLKGTADLSKLVKFTVNADKSGTWVIGDAVQNHNDGGGASGDDWVGRLVFISATVVTVQINAASTDYASVAIADGIDNTTRTEEIAGVNTTAKACPGITIATASGTDGVPIYLIGCNGSFVENGTKVVLDGHDLAAQCVETNKNFYVVRNVDAMQAVANGFTTISTATPLIWVLVNVDSHDHGADGWGAAGGAGWLQSTWIRCRAYNNISHGWGVVTNGPGFVGCSAIGNGQRGWTGGAYYKMYGCIAHQNGGWGVYMNYGPMANCVVDGNGESVGSTGGVIVSDGPVVIVNSRITDNTGYGLNASTAMVYSINNTFLNNTSGATTGSVVISILDGADTNITTGAEGYISEEGNNFGLLPTAAGYRVSLALGDGINSVGSRSGLPVLDSLDNLLVAGAGNYVVPVQAGYSALAAGYGAGGATAGTLAAAKIMDGTYGTLSLDNVLVAGGGHYVEPVAAQVWNAASGGTAYGASGGYGTFDKTLYTLISGVVAASKVLYGNDNYTGGAAGALTLPNAGTAPYTANPALVLAAGRYGVVGSLVSGTAPVQNITFTETVITRQ